MLGAADLAPFTALAARDAVANVFADYRARTTNLDPRWLGGEVWGYFEEGELTAACHVAANLVPVQCDAVAAQAFAERALARGRTSSTIVGLSEPVGVMWDVLAGEWGPPRECRWRQPHLVISGDPVVEPDPEVRPCRREDLVSLYPACVAMYTEEVGVSPEAGGGADYYRARIMQLIARGWSFARFDDDGRVLFKAEVACVTPHAAQVQGVFVPRELRGRGLATAGMAAVVAAVRRDIAPTVSLYVNEWNGPARAAYERVGFQQSGTFSTIMF